VSSLGYRAGVLGAIVNLLLNCPEIYKTSIKEKYVAKEQP
jgi:hypothetical protein